MYRRGVPQPEPGVSVSLAVSLATLVCVVSAAGSARGADRNEDTGIERIVSLAPSVTEILFALGVGDRVVGVSTYCDYPPQVARIDRIGTFLSPNVELILKHRPDLVIGVPSPANHAPVESLEDLGLRVLIVDPEGVKALYAAIRRVADAVGVAAEGERLVKRIETEVARVEAPLRGVSRPRVLMLVGLRPLVAVGAGSYQDELIRLAGGTNVAAETGEEWPRLGVEFVLSRAPEVIIDAGVEENAGERRAYWASFPTIPAVRDERIYSYGAKELLRPGPRVAHTLETIARFLHPERFPDATPSPAAGGPS
jgi:iron complex transport system substrate-binding protein